MNFTPRYYQSEARDAVWSYMRANSTGNPCVVLPTGSGKGSLIPWLASDVCQWGGRAIATVHAKELVADLANRMQSLFGLDVGVYSAGLKSRNKSSQVIVGGIQSVYKRALELSRSGPFRVLFIDEAHCCPLADSTSQYRTFTSQYRTFIRDLLVSNPGIRIVGLTATPYRTGQGYICDSEESVFSEIVYEAGVYPLIQQGFLSPLVSQVAHNQIETSDVEIRKGDFVASQLDAAAMENVIAACSEFQRLSYDRRKRLVFACGIPHAEQIAKLLDCPVVHGKVPAKQRDSIIKQFCEKETGTLVNVNVLTTGFDAPDVDCIGLIRSTVSPGLFYQMCGRGLRIHPGKRDCLVLDFGGNIDRHGCIDDIDPPKVSYWTCPECDTQNKNYILVCPLCSYERTKTTICPDCNTALKSYETTCACGWEKPKPPPKPRKPQHDTHAGSDSILSFDVKDVTYTISEVDYRSHTSRSSGKTSLCVIYYDGLRIACKEYVCLEHTGYAHSKAWKWWQERSTEPVPATVEEALEKIRLGALAETFEITVRKPPGRDKFPNIIDHKISVSKSLISHEAG